jgi:glycosyltransferase involved in cell wall biosynthesis
MENNIKISVCIPTYEAGGKGVFFLQKNIEGILKQTYDNFEIIISDHSKNSEIENYISSLSHPKITYFRYKEHIGKPAYNTNNAINNSTGDYIKIMNQDDYIKSDDFFQKAIDLIKGGSKWVLSNFTHLNYNTGEYFKFMTPSFRVDGRHLLDGRNSIGCPSVGLIPKGELIDVNVTYMIDCELWYRLFIKYGQPGLVGGGYPIIIGAGDHQLTDQLRREKKIMMENDKQYCKKLYNNK